jgi:hypothetical protein
LFFQSRRVTTTVEPDLLRVLESIGAQAGYHTPWLFVPLAFVWGRALLDGPRVPRAWFVALLAAGPIIFFTAANVFARGLPHWPMPGWLFAFPLLGAAIARLEDRRPRLVLYGASAMAVTLLVGLAALTTHAMTGWMTRNVPARIAQRDPTLDLLDWTDLDAVLAERRLIDESTPAVAGTHWIRAGKLNYAIGRTVPVLCLCADPQHFRFLHDPATFAGRNLIVIDTRAHFDRHGTEFSRWFSRIEPLAPIVLRRAGRPAIELVVYRGHGFAPARP